MAVAKIVVSVRPSSVVVGRTAQANASLFGAKGEAITNQTVSWSTLQPTIASVSATGVVTGIQSGNAIIRAAVGTVTADGGIAVQPVVAASIQLSSDSATIFIPNGAVQLLPLVKDSSDALIPNPTIFWQTSAPLIATVNANGLVTGVAAGIATVRATIDGQTAVAVITVKPTVNVNAPVITVVSATLRPGATVTVTGTNFAPTVGGNAVLVDGVAATVTAASATQLTFTLPATGFICDPTHAVFVQVTANGLIGGGAASLQVATARALAPGQSVLVTNAAEVRCNELTQSGGRYVMSVYNAAKGAVTSGNTNAVAFTVRGVASTAAALAVAPAVDTRRAAAWSGVVPRIGAAEFDRAELLRRARAADAAHAGVLEQNIEFVKRNGAAMRAWNAARRQRRQSLSASASAIGTAGAITPLKVPNLDAANFCVTSVPVSVRTAYVGQRAIIVEDTATTTSTGAPTLAGQNDAYYAQLGQEFDAVMWPILTTNFGNPLAMDALLSGTGKVIMVFSPRINAMQQGRVIGFVVSCDFAPVAQAPSSNLGEYFYAIVPTSAAAGFANGETKDSWLRTIRSTVIHEVKHVTAFGERISRNLSLEDLSWEEGMARNAEEIYARGIYGIQAKQNALYANTLFCDVRAPLLAPPQCVGRPYLMYRHFDPLYAWLGAPEQLTPLGRVFPTDLSFYASSWAFLRWAADQYGATEAQFLKDFTVSPVSGALNLEARTGRTFDELLGLWSLALFLDDLTGFTPANVKLTMPSWNFRDIWFGMCSDFGPCTNPGNTQQLFTRPSPAQPRTHPFGAFSDDIAGLAGGSFTWLDLSGAAAGRQLLEVRAFGGGDPPPSLRLAIVRIQ